MEAESSLDLMEKSNESRATATSEMETSKALQPLLAASVSSKSELMDKDVDVMLMETGDASAAPHKFWLMFSFTLFGLAQLMYWNCLLPLLTPLRETIYQDHTWVSNSVNAVNNSAGVLTAIYLVKTGGVRPGPVFWAINVSAACCLLTAFVLQFLEGSAGVWCLLILSFISGAAGSFFQTGGFALGAVMAIPVGGYFSFGQGISGIFCWFVWFCLETSAYPKANLKEVRICSWILMSIALCITLAASVIFRRLVANPDIKARLKHRNEILIQEKKNPNAPSYLELLKQSWAGSVGIFLTFGATLYIFPSIGPLEWKTESRKTTWLFFCYQIGDLVGRYVPNISKWFVMNPFPLFCFSAFRAVFIIVFGLLGWKKADEKFLGNFTWLVLLMLFIAISNGANCTNVFITVEKSVKDPAYIPKVCSLFALSLLTAISVGLWSSYATVQGAK